MKELKMIFIGLVIGLNLGFLITASISEYKCSKSGFEHWDSGGCYKEIKIYEYKTK